VSASAVKGAVFFGSAQQSSPPIETGLNETLGGKGASLVQMTRLGLSVPPGFVLATSVCRDVFERGWQPAHERLIRSGLVTLEAAVGRTLGSFDNPLLLSVRSGAATSMPGMMDTVLNVGMTAEVAAGLLAATGDETFAADTFHRAAMSQAEIVAEVSGADLERCRRAHHPGDLSATINAWAEAHERNHDPVAQVIESIRAVFRSWNLPRAQKYREVEHIPDDLGTAAVIQQMVFGNMPGRSGTGVAFTRDPASGAKGMFGDFLERAQGEDVVDGRHDTSRLTELDRRWPDLASELATAASTLEHHYQDMVDIEFTIEGGTLYLLQARAGKRSPEAAFRIAVELAEDSEFEVDREEAVRRCRHLLADKSERISGSDAGSDTVLAVGLPASPGRASGVLAVDLDDAIKRSVRGQDVVLARPTTTPSDVAGMVEAVALITTHGGLVSHAAVVARSWGLPAVVGATDITVCSDGIAVGGEMVAVGTLVTVDGSTGEVMVGAAGTERQTIPAAQTLLAWSEAMVAEGGRS